MSDHSPSAALRHRRSRLHAAPNKFREVWSKRSPGKRSDTRDLVPSHPRMSLCSCGLLASPPTRPTRYPDQRTSSGLPGMSGWCHEETHAPHNLTGYSITSSARPPLFWRQIILQMLVEPVNSKLDRLAARLIVNPIVFNAGNHDQLLRSYRAFIGALRIGFV